MLSAGHMAISLTVSGNVTTKIHPVLVGPLQNWLPIHDWQTDEVWDCIIEHGDVAHPAYRLEQPNQRLSCALCILASLNDLMNGAIHNPDTYREYCRIEAVTGYSFRKDFWLSSIRPELLPQETLDAVRNHQRIA